MKSKESNSKKSVSYQKKDGRGHARPSFFWYDNDKDLKVCSFVTRVMCSASYTGCGQTKHHTTFPLSWELKHL